MPRPKLRPVVRDQVEIQILSIDQMVPKDHPVREIWAFVESVNLDALHGAVRSEEGRSGAPAIDPRVLLCLWLYAAADSVGSARRLAKLTEESPAYRWITGGQPVNYHTLSNFRAGCGQTLERLLTGCLAALAEEGLVNPDTMTVAHDGMRTRAAAGVSSFHRRQTLEKHLVTAKAHLDKLNNRGEAPNDDGDGDNRRSKAAQQRAASDRRERLERALEVMTELEENQRKRSDREPREPRVSSTDPEARLQRMANGGTNPAYNIQFTTETQTRAISAVMIAPGGSDTGVLLPAMENHRRAHGVFPSATLADQGYFKYADIEALEGANCAVFMPDLYPQAKRDGQADSPMIDRWRQRMKTEQARERYRLRASTAEWTNARMRQQGLVRLTVRGSAKVLSVALLHALAHNVGRLVSLCGSISQCRALRRKTVRFSPVMV